MKGRANGGKKGKKDLAEGRSNISFFISGDSMFSYPGSTPYSHGILESIEFDISSMMSSWDPRVFVLFSLLYGVKARCRKPKSSKFAELKGGERKHFYRIGTTLTYICRPGYNSIPGISQLITCLESRTWSALPVFCERKSCGHPGKPKYGDVVILTDLLYTAKVTFTCEKGYKLIGSPSTKCVLKGDRVEWEAKLPQCQRSTEGTTEETVKKKPGVKNIAAIIVGLSLGALILAIVIILALFFLLKHLR
nr:C4b-binding protein alpha chain-like isoform X2 [Pogona vitticeps]